MWEITTFVLNALLFVLLGLQLPSILDALQGEPTCRLLWWAALVSGTVIVARIVWVFPATYLPRWLSARVRAAIRLRRGSTPPQSPGWGSEALSRWRRRSRCRR